MNEKTSKCSFDTICIGESLPNSERQSGTHLYNDMDNWVKALRPGVGVSHTKISDSKSLLNWLQSINDATKLKGCLPVIHIEAHGSEEGIQLSSGEFVKWTEISDILREINMRTKNNLLLVVSACFGAHGIQIADIFEATPFFGIIGPNIKVSVEECESGYQKFYQSLLSDLNLSLAKKELNSVLNDEKKSFQFHSAQDLFIEVAISYLKNHNSAKARRPRVENLVSMILASPVGHKFTLKTAREAVKNAYKNDQGPFILDTYKNFMMLDKYPENEERFELSFEEIKEILKQRRDIWRLTITTSSH